jgi:hypothetical protein
MDARAVRPITAATGVCNERSQRGYLERFQFTLKHEEIGIRPLLGCLLIQR